jgi:NAD(P)-dependent dehydrogenase (short-subunit alcohol dehydrogenase family)
VNNAGIMWCPYKKTVDGFEPHFGCNHLAHFLFTALIFPRIVASSSPSSPSRVINVSSMGHRRSDIRFDDVGFDDGKAYGERAILF